MALKSAMEQHGIAQTALDRELDLYKGTVSRALAGRSIEPVFRLAAKLGYAATGEDLEAVFKCKQTAALNFLPPTAEVAA